MSETKKESFLVRKFYGLPMWQVGIVLLVICLLYTSDFIYGEIK